MFGKYQAGPPRSLVALIVVASVWVTAPPRVASHVGVNQADDADPCYDAANTFSFFTFSDAYPGASDDGVRRVLRDAVDHRQYPYRLIPRFWLVAGDFPFAQVSDTRIDELNSVISGRRSYPFVRCAASNREFPYFIALGNHDAEPYLGAPIDQMFNVWSNIVGNKVARTLVGIENVSFGPDNGYDARTTYSFEYQNAHFVVANLYYGDPAYPDYDTGPTACILQDLHDWIDQDLAATDKRMKFVVGHVPAWPFCSEAPGHSTCISYGNDFGEDVLSPSERPRPHSSTGDWGGPYGRHYFELTVGCPLVNGQHGRDAFWEMLARHEVVAHYVGHTHTYSSRLVQADGTRNRDAWGRVLPQSETNRLAYGKTGEIHDISEGVWEIDSGRVHNSAGAAYVLTTVRDNTVTFESYDMMGTTESFGLIETWAVTVGAPSPEATPPVRLSGLTVRAGATASASSVTPAEPTTVPDTDTSDADTSGLRFVGRQRDAGVDAPAQRSSRLESALAEIEPPSDPNEAFAEVAPGLVSAATRTAGYLIGPGDVLSVDFWRETDLSGEVLVRPDGQISVPLLDDIRAAGLTPGQLREVLVARAERYFDDPRVTVVVEEINSRNIFITGRVSQPGSYQLVGSTTVLQLIARAGGLLEYADAKKITITRTTGGQPTSFRFNYKEIAEGKNLHQNIELQPGDTVIVP